MTAAATAGCLVAAVLAGLRWLRVAQREHYLAGSCSRFARRWWWDPRLNRLLLAGALVNLVLSFTSPLFALLVTLPVAVGPLGLSLRGRSPGPLRWTRRARTLGAVWAGLSLAAVSVAALLRIPAPGAALVALAAPLLVDAALAVTAPLERRLGRTFVDQAAGKLRSIAPTVIAITGSYGKTSTKAYAAHLIGGSRSVVATPASFNNSAGLARAVNENLTPGTDVFVAEMGTYGPGEIAALCRWVRPTISAITAIGPVHIERMGSEEVIAAAKAEIFATAETCVLNVDSEWLATMVEDLRGRGKRVVRCSAADITADVVARHDDGALVVIVEGDEIARVDGVDAAPTNVAVAVALAREVGVPTDVVARRLPTLPAIDNRRSMTTGSTGATFIDDTYNSNPAGAAAALAMLRRHAAGASRVVVVTPGMVELGLRQAAENEEFAAAAAETATDIVIVGSTNRAALLAGARRGGARAVVVDDRAGATAWVKENTDPAAVVLFENDLPDHFP